jgi:hypothetical protein
MPINSRSKGARIERQVRDLFREHGFTAERGQQRAGGADSPDVKVAELPKLHIEAKGVQKLNLDAAIAQAQRDAGAAKQWCVIHRKDKQPFRITMGPELFFALMREGCDCLNGKDQV